ncbi:hypothetical protein RBH94_14355 [Aestuariibaculum sp. YM273]|uniref:M61 family metallopeptidase n=1 Tax=Aestuariibaculum sp. YM273 TaxID=3070659 RepID=UPI0027DAC0E7|nr:hypothetical protein [Aestuariibaculum sp. YM273]WMI65234.1 hypothetical protein RBH94_14355 [Aestuariibaculum sp. YM273]
MKTHFLHKSAFSLLFFVMLFNQGVSQPILNYEAFFEDPEHHYVEVRLNIENVTSKKTSLILPVWSPGYYEILDFPKNIVDFKVVNNNHQELNWYKIAKNKWVVDNQDSKTFSVSYRYFANQKSVAESNIDNERAFIMPNNIFMHVENELNVPVNLKITPYKIWKTISTGLQKTGNNTFFAKTIDILYDSPIYIGNPHVFNFEYNNIPFSVAIAKPEGLDESKFRNDLKKIVDATTDLMHDIPFENYSFILMEEGGGGLEHWNSQAVFTSGSFYFEHESHYTDFLNFITHEYFHLYNVKAIRPVELGPFNYSKENYTNMLWVSEGLTVYYEYIIMMRAGLLDKKSAFNYFTNSIKRYENIEGKNHMSLARSSFDIWLNFFNHNVNAEETTISYYNKGPIIGLLMDLEIRNNTNNKKSLDDVMRFLYNEYYLKQNRGFKEEEFWDVCKSISGSGFDDIKEYVYTVKDIDYQKYFDYAGLNIDLTPLSDASVKEELVKRVFTITEKEKITLLQRAIRDSVFIKD